MTSAADGLILSSFQVLEHRDDVSKADHDLDHFLHPYGQEGAPRLGGDAEGADWKTTTTDMQRITCRQETSNQLPPLPPPPPPHILPPDMHHQHHTATLNTATDHHHHHHHHHSETPSFLNDFRSDDTTPADIGEQRSGRLHGDGACEEEEEEDDEEDEEEEGDEGGEEGDAEKRSGPSVVKHCLHGIGDEHKADGFDDLQVATPDLLTSHKQGFMELDSGLGDHHAFMNPATACDSWSQGIEHHGGSDSTSSDWPADGKRMVGGNDVTRLEEPEAVGKSWNFLQSDHHGNPSLQAHHQWMNSAEENKLLAEAEMASHHCQEGWGTPGAKMLSSQSNEPWGEKSPPQPEGHHHPHALQVPTARVSASSVGPPPSHHWAKQGTQLTAPDGMPWMPDVDGVYPEDSPGPNVCKLFQMPPTSTDGLPPASTGTTFVDMHPVDSCVAQQQQQQQQHQQHAWPLDSPSPQARAGVRLPSRTTSLMDTANSSSSSSSSLCRRLASPGCLRGALTTTPAAHGGYHRYQGPHAGAQQQEVWSQQAHTSTPMCPASPMAPQCVNPATATAMQQGPGPSLGPSKRPLVSRRPGVTVTPTLTPAMTTVAAGDGVAVTSRPLLDQARKQAHPYLMKDSKKGARDKFPGTGGNVHTLKASHIVSWYIDYLIHENEHLTQISRAFSLPVNLFHSDDFYFMESVKKKVHFPSLKFLSWMQQNLPSINVNAVDFHEGRPPVVSVWNQDWFWQNKSRRDIIHDVFFYFQHRRVTCAI